MLKKLAKYGNSNALVIDKAIMELLNMQENEVVKLTTDGKSLTITPISETSSVEVQEDFTSQDAILIAAARSGTVGLKNTSAKEKQAIEDKYLSMLKKQQELSTKLSKNLDYIKELQDLNKDLAANNPAEYIKQTTAIRNKYSPELSETMKKLFAFGNEIAEKAGKPKINTEEMQADFAKAFSGQAKNMAKDGKIIQSEEHQHRMQLLADKFKGNENSEELIKEIGKIMREISPESAELQDKLVAVGKKHGIKKAKSDTFK